MSDKARVFVASSSIALPYATAVQRHLEDKHDVRVWKDWDDYECRTIPEWVTALPEKFDFGIFIFSNDDTSQIGGKTYAVTRDNVLYELGLFTGKLGVDRYFVVRPNVENFRLATDLQGITEERFNLPGSPQEVTSALRTACDRISKIIDARWRRIQEARSPRPQRVAAVCYKSTADGNVEFLLVNSSDRKRRGFPKSPVAENEDPVQVAIRIAKEEGGVIIDGAPVTQFNSFSYFKESKQQDVQYKPYVFRVRDNVVPENNDRQPAFHSLESALSAIKAGRDSVSSYQQLARIICRAYTFLLENSSGG